MVRQRLDALHCVNAQTRAVYLSQNSFSLSLSLSLSFHVAQTPVQHKSPAMNVVCVVGIEDVRSLAALVALIGVVGSVRIVCVGLLHCTVGTVTQGTSLTSQETDHRSFVHLSDTCHPIWIYS